MIFWNDSVFGQIETLIFDLDLLGQKPMASLKTECEISTKIKKEGGKKPMKYGVRDVVDVVLRAKGTMDLGNKRFYKNEPVLYFDTLTTSTLEGASTTVYANGGKGNARLMAWEGERTVTFTMEDALISPESLSILTGAGLIEASDEKPVFQHIVETTDAFELNSAGDELTVYVDKEPFLPIPDSNGSVENENYACVMFTKDGEVISEPYIVDQNNGTAVSNGIYAVVEAVSEGAYAGKYKMVVNGHDCNFGSDCHPEKDTYSPDNLKSDKLLANGVLIDYYTPVRSGAKQIEIDAEKFAGSYYLEGSTLWRDTNGVDHPAEFVIPNCKIQSAFTFTMAATGDPSTFTFTMDAFPDFTRFDKTHKVFAAIQIIESATTASDANNDLHRGRTWAGGSSYAAGSEGSDLDNHDN